MRKCEQLGFCTTTASLVRNKQIQKPVIVVVNQSRRPAISGSCGDGGPIRDLGEASGTTQEQLILNPVMIRQIQVVVSILVEISDGCVSGAYIVTRGADDRHQGSAGVMGEAAISVGQVELVLLGVGSSGATASVCATGDENIGMPVTVHITNGRARASAAHW